MDVGGRPWTSEHSGGRQGRPRGRQAAPDGSPGPSRCELQLLLSVTKFTTSPSPSFALQTAMPCIGRWTASHPVEHDVSLSDAAEYLALYSLRYGLGGV